MMLTYGASYDIVDTMKKNSIWSNTLLNINIDIDVDVDVDVDITHLLFQHYYFPLYSSHFILHPYYKHFLFSQLLS